jgi:hypothetical protein
VLQTQQGSENVCVKRGGVGLRSLVENATGLAFCSRTVDRHVKSAETADDPVDQLADFFVISNIGRKEDGVGATLQQLTFEYLALGHTAAGHGDPSAGFGERQGRGPTNPGQGAGNENDRAVHDQTPSRHAVGRMAVRPLAYGNHATQAP